MSVAEFLLVQTALLAVRAALAVAGNSTAIDPSQIPTWVNTFSISMQTILTTVNSAIVDIMQLVWVTLVVLGLLLYATHLHKRLGKDLFMGGVLMAAVVDFVLPAVSNL